MRILPLAAGILTGAVLVRERQRRQAAERVAAAVLETLLRAIDANDGETGEHVRRVARYALLLAEAADMDESEQRSVERIALFHDVGKIDEALFDIIHDPSDLTDEEREAIRTHPARGADVLAPLAVFYPELADGVLSHHERCDGKGYPRGLKGRRIPLGARVVAIADTFYALTHGRRYRDAEPSDFARKVLLEGRGTQFDPDFVDLFLFPPVFARVANAEHEIVTWKPPVHKRRSGHDDEIVPHITFRWRPGPNGSRGRPASDPTRQTAR
jgi:putative two-component system response regulator